MATELANCKALNATANLIAFFIGAPLDADEEPLPSYQGHIAAWHPSSQHFFTQGQVAKRKEHLATKRRAIIHCESSRPAGRAVPSQHPQTCQICEPGR